LAGTQVVSKDLAERLPTSVQKSYFLLGSKEREVLNQALSKYRPGQSEPILIGGEKLLKPASKLMSFYRLRIDEIKEDAVVTSYTRWLEAVIVKGTENQEIYVTFSPQFERIWLESKKRLPEYVFQKPATLELRSRYSIRFYDWAKKYIEAGTKTASHSSGLTGERIGFLLSEVDLPRFGVLDPRIIRSLSWVKPPITSIIRSTLE
jgi:hypothetical protein